MIPDVQHVSRQGYQPKHCEEVCEANEAARLNNWLFHHHHTNPKGEN